MPVATVSSKGQIVIPRRIRERLRLEEGARVEIELSGTAVVLRPIRSGTKGWRRWRGAFAGRGLLKALADEHAADIGRSSKPRS